MDKDISLYAAARWIASMAAADGVVSPNERKILREFAETYDFNVSALYRMAYASFHTLSVILIYSLFLASSFCLSVSIRIA